MITRTTAILLSAPFLFTACDGEKAQQAREKTAEAAKAIGEAASEAGSKAGEQAGNVLNKIKEKTGPVLEKGRELGGAALEKGKELGSAAVEKIKERAPEIKAAAAEAWSKLSEKSKAAVESFKQKMGGLPDWLKARERELETGGSRQGKSQVAMQEFLVKLGAVDTADLPADLAKAFTDYRAASQKGQLLMASMPTEKDAAEKWELDHADQLHRLEIEMTAATTALEAAAAKYGMDGFKLNQTE